MNFEEQEIWILIGETTAIIIVILTRGTLLDPIYFCRLLFSRSAIRGSLQTVESSLEKAQLEAEIVKLDKQLEVTDKEVTKLSILAQEVGSIDTARHLA